MKKRLHRIAAATSLLLACTSAMATPPDSPEALRQSLLDANSRNDVSAAQRLLCGDGAEPEALAVFQWLFARDVGTGIISATLEPAPPALAGEEFTVKPDGLLHLHFDSHDKNGDPNPEPSVAYPFGKIGDTYCFLVPL